MKARPKEAATYTVQTFTGDAEVWERRSRNEKK